VVKIKRFKERRFEIAAEKQTAIENRRSLKSNQASNR